MKETLRRQIEQAMAEERARGIPTHPAGDGQTVPDGGDGQTLASLNGELAPSQMYEPGPEIACGGMGAILRARDLNLRRTVAMKVILGGHQASRQHHRRFLQEARLTGLLEHPGIVPVYELGTDNQGQPFYTMKFVQGTTLQQVLEQIETGHAETIAHYSLAHLLTVFQKVCDAVAFAHSKGVIHRDLKPANIMLGDYGEVLVMDWGLAKVVAADGWKNGTVEECAQPARDPTIPPSALTLAGQVMGSPSFMAPEQADGRIDQIDARTDVWALGAVLYNILTLQPPVRGDSVREILEKVKTGRIDSPTSVTEAAESKGSRSRGGRRSSLPHCPRGRLPEALSAVTMKALAPRPADRYQSVPDLQRDLEAYQNGFATAVEQAGPFKLIWLLIKRHRVEFIVSHTALLILLLAGIAFTVQVTREKNRAEQTLAELTATAPTFYDEAVALVKDQAFEPALAKIAYAIKLRPGEADYHGLRGNLYESLLRIPEARAAYAEALRCNQDRTAAAENLALCEKIQRENEGRSNLLPNSLQELHIAMLRQGRSAEAVAMLRRFAADKQRVYDTWKAVLEQNGIWARMPQDGGVHLLQNEDGTIDLDLGALSLGDLSPIRGMPLRALRLDGNPVSDLTPLKGMPLVLLTLNSTRVSDLSPLRGMSLEELWLSTTLVTDLRPLHGMPLKKLMLTGTRVTDLSPLRGMRLTLLSLEWLPISDLGAIEGMPLQDFSFNNTQVADLTPLKGMPLQRLHLTGTPVRDVGPLRGLPLREINLAECPNLREVSPLAECRQLERLVIPAQCTDIEPLRQLPNLQRLGYEWPSQGWDKVPTPAEFWKAYDAKMASGQKAVSGSP